MIGRHLKEHKKALADARKSQARRYRIKKNNDWRKRWLPFIKYDHDFDGAFFLELIVYKLHVMLDYYEHGKYCIQVDESRLQIVDSLREACRLGDMLLADEFDAEAYAIMDAHLSFDHEPLENGSSKLNMLWDDPKNKEAYDKANAAADAEREKTVAEFFDYLRVHFREWWD